MSTNPTPTVDGIMSLVRQYAAARLCRNASTPTRSASEWARELHRKDDAECARLERAIASALERAGIPREPALSEETYDRAATAEAAERNRR